MSLLAMSLTRIAERWWEYVVNASWQAALVGLSALVLVRIGRRWPAPWRCGLLLVALLKFACPPMIAAPTGLFSQWAAADWGLAGDAETLQSNRAAMPVIRLPAPLEPKEFAREPTRQASAPHSRKAERDANIFANDSDKDEVVPTLSHAKSQRDGANEAALPSQIAGEQPRLRWRVWLMLSHLAGVLVFAAWTAGQLWRLRCLIRSSRDIAAGPHHEQMLALCRTMKLRRTPRLLESQEAISPMALGILRPTVVIPSRVLEGLAPGDVRTVLAHELAHLRRGDAWLNWLRIVLLAVWWFHPVAWLLSRALRHVHEDCCDDMLLAGGLIGEADYCETLLRVAAKASSGAAGLALGMAQQLHPLGHRLLRIMDEKARRRAGLSAGGVGTLVLLAGVLLPGLSRRPVDASPATPDQQSAADEESDKKDQGAKVAEALSAEPANEAESDESDFAIEGLVVDAAKKPAAGAEVWLVSGDWGDETAEVRAVTTTDEKGRFAFRQFTADELFKTATGRSFLLARDRRRQLGWIVYLQPADAQRIFIALHEVADFRGKLVDASGQPIVGARIQPRSLSTAPLRGPELGGVSLPFELVSRWDTKTSDNGEFVLRDMPADGSLTARVAAVGFGTPLLRWDLGHNVEIRLERAGAIAGYIQLPSGADLPKELTLILFRQAESPMEGARFGLRFSTLKPVDEQGHFEFADAPPGKYVISLQQARHSALYGDPTGPILLSAGERVADVKLPLHRTVVVRGVAVDNRDKKPVKGVALQFNKVESNGRWQPLTDETTDANGRFTAYVRPGQIAIRPVDAPAGYLAVFQGDASMKPVDAEKDVETVVEVERAIQVKGAVVDASGTPVPNAELQIMMPWRLNRHGAPPQQKADESGAFVLDDVDPSDTLPVRARSKTAVTDGAVLLRPEQLREPVRLEVRDANACRLTGQVVDELGQPIKRAVVSLNANRGYQSLRAMRGTFTDVQVERIETDRDGRFLSGALWPRDSYQASVSNEGYVSAQSQRLVGKPRETLDAGVIVLRRNDGFVEGSVVDSAGQAVAGATIFNSGDGLEPASITTAADGRFRLQGLFSGPVYIFARKPGFRFTGLRTTSGTNDIKMTLLAETDPPPMDQPAALPTITPQHEALARWMLERLWELPQATNKWVLVRCMARLDEEQARQWSVQLGQASAQQVFVGASERLLGVARQSERSLDNKEPLAVAAELSDDRACDFLASLAELNIARDPEKSSEFIEQALLRVSNVPPPRHTSHQARLGGLLLRLGRRAAGRELIDKAADEAQTSGQNWFVRHDVIAELASYDLPRCKKLIEPIVDPLGRNRLLEALAVASAESDLDDSLATAAEIKGDLNADSIRNHALLEIAYRLAVTQPDEALHVVDLMDGYDGDKIRAEALGWLAVAIAPRDKRAAYGLIDRSLALYLDQPDSFRSWGNYGGRCALAAWTARHAREIRYPDMHGVVMRVLATRPSLRDEHDPIRRLEAQVAMALILGFSAPETANQVLQSCAPSDGLVGSGHSSIRRGEWLEAWALANPASAKELFQQELAAAKGMDKIDLQTSELVQAADLLSLPAGQWPRRFAADFGAIWFPGEEWMVKYGRFSP